MVSPRAPIGSERVYEIKHDGYRLMVRKMDDRVRIYTRRGADWTNRFPRIVEAVEKLNCETVLIDGEGIVARADGLAEFDRLHSRENDALVALCAFDLLELDGEDLRKLTLRARKALLHKLVGRRKTGIQFNDHFGGDGAEIFAEACRLGCEGIVAKRIDLPYQSGRSKRWLKIKNPDSPAARRGAGGDFLARTATFT